MIRSPGAIAPVAMHDQAGLQRPPRPRLGLDRRQRLLGHPRIVLELHRRERARRVAHQPGEAHHRADVRPPRRQRRRARRRRRSPRAGRRTATQPPVIGGKNATSRTPGERRREVRHLLVHRHPHRPHVGEGERIALLAPLAAPRRARPPSPPRSPPSPTARPPARAARRNSARVRRHRLRSLRKGIAFIR